MVTKEILEIDVGKFYDEFVQRMGFINYKSNLMNYKFKGIGFGIKLMEFLSMG
jgi:hypothetical protein